VSIIKTIALALLVSACASPQIDGGLRAAAKPIRGGIAEFQLTSYEGKDIKGRLLIGATIDTLVIDGRLLGTPIDVRTLQRCDKNGPVPFVEECIVAPPPRPDELVTIRPGHWYGRNVNYGILPGGGPDCLDAELVVTALDDRLITRLPIRVVRTDKPETLPAPADAP
jgi:hypothetical protein